MPEPFVCTRFDQLDVDSIAASGWPDLYSAQADARFYHHPDWLLAADECLLTRPLEICCVAQNEQLVLLLPWQASIRRHRFHTPSHDHLSLGDILVHPDLAQDARKSAVNCALSLAGNALWDWQAGNLPARSSLFSSIGRAGPSRHSSTEDTANKDRAGCTRATANAAADAIAQSEHVRKHPIHATQQDTLWEFHETRQSAWFDLRKDNPPASGKLRRNLGRLRRQLQDTGRIRAEWISQAELLPDALDRFLVLEDAGWKGAHGELTAIADDPGLTRFYQQLLAPRFSGMTPVITLLWLDEQCIAAQFGLQTGSCLSLLKIAYSEVHGHFSPGSLLLQDTAQIARQRGLCTLSLVTAPAWAARWHPHTEPVWHVTRYANNAGGRAMRALHRLRQTVRARRRSAA